MINYNDLLDVSLTIESPEIEKVATYQMSENIDGWDKEIIKIVHEDLPYVTNYNYEIEFKKLDKKYGYAVGSVKFTNIKDLYIPIIIRNHSMSPLDVIVSSSKSMPLTEHTFESIVSNKTDMGTLRDPLTTQPFLERQNTQAYEDVSYPISKYAFLGIGKGDSNIYKVAANNNQDFLIGYKNNNTVGILKNAMNVPAKPNVVVSNEKVDGKSIGDVDSSIYKSVEKTGSYKIANISNKFKDGLYINNVYDFDLEKQAFGMFICDDDTYGYQEKYAGIECPYNKKNKYIKSKIDSMNKSAGIGDTVTFIANKNDSCFSTVPVKIASKSNIDGYEKISGHTVLGEPIDIYMTPSLKTITKTAENVYHIPSNRMRMFKIGSFNKFHWNPEVIKNQSIAKYANNTTKVSRDGSMFTVENEYIKTAGTLTPSELYENLKDYYSNAIDMVKEAAKNDSILFTGVKVASVVDREKVDFGFDVNGLFKIASALTDPDAVDAVLSLGYINETTIDDYVKMIPDFENVINQLAKMLLSIRLGLKCEEYPVKQAMSQLQLAVDNLKKYRK